MLHNIRRCHRIHLWRTSQVSGFRVSVLASWRVTRGVCHVRLATADGVVRMRGSQIFGAVVGWAYVVGCQMMGNEIRIKNLFVIQFHSIWWSHVIFCKMGEWIELTTFYKICTWFEIDMSRQLKLTGRTALVCDRRRTVRQVSGRTAFEGRWALGGVSHLLRSRFVRVPAVPLTTSG